MSGWRYVFAHYSSIVGLDLVLQFQINAQNMQKEKKYI